MKSRRIGLAIALVLSVSTAVLGQISDVFFGQIDQIAPDSRTFLTATVWGSCGYEGVPIVKVTGSQIAIDVPFTGGACIPAGVPIQLTAKIGPLPAGLYDVTTHGRFNSKLLVRGVDPFRTIPAGGPTTGGNIVKLTNDHQIDFDGRLQWVTFGGVIIKNFLATGSQVAVYAPPHPAGDVDVSMVYLTDDGKAVNHTAVATYRYADPGAVPDAYVTEPLLFPVALEGNGAYGSNWTTDSTLSVTTNWDFVSFWQKPCATCPSTLWPYGGGPDSVTLDKVTLPAGRVIHVLRGTGDSVSATLRVRDLSRQSGSGGVDVPVVREREFRDVLRLDGIPTDSRFRVMLRVWCRGSGVGPFEDAYPSYLGIFSGPNKWISIPLELAPTEPGGLSFTSIDLTPFLQALTAYPRASIYLHSFSERRYWAMASITNNETQEVTISVPH